MGVKISVYMQFEKQIYSLYFIHSQGVLFLQTALVGRRLVGVCILRKPAKPCGYWLHGFLLDFLITRRSCGSNPISATSKVLRIQRGSKDFFLFYLDFHKLSYFYIYSFLDRSIWAASGRREVGQKGVEAVFFHPFDRSVWKNYHFYEKSPFCRGKHSVRMPQVLYAAGIKTVFRNLFSFISEYFSMQYALLYDDSTLYLWAHR